MLKGNSVLKHKMAEFRQKSKNQLMLVQCGGLNTKHYSRTCDNKILLRIGGLGSIEEIHAMAVSVDWRIGMERLGKTADTADSEAIISLQCTDCWIDSFRIMHVDSAPTDKILKSVDPEGKFTDRLKEKFTKSGE